DYNDYYSMIKYGGWVEEPRGMKTYALRNVLATWRPLWFPRREGDNPAIGIIEGLQFIAGVFDHDAISAAAPRARLDLFTHQSAYGPRVMGQLAWVVQQLRDDPNSRRAQMMIADPQDSAETLPCTTSMQFHLDRDGQGLHTTVTMRSSDAVWGLPYDLIQFGMVAEVVASCLGVRQRSMATFLGNAHVYHATDADREWGEDQVIMPHLTSVDEWQLWASRLVSARLGGGELMDQFLASRLSNGEPEYV